MIFTCGSFDEQVFDFGLFKSSRQVSSKRVYKLSTVKCIRVEHIGSSRVVQLRFLGHCDCLALQSTVDLVSPLHPLRHFAVATVCFGERCELVIL